MVKIILNKTTILSTKSCKYADILHEIETQTRMISGSDFYLEYNGKRFTDEHEISCDADTDAQVVHCILRVCGGKGGFGSMLRAIGAQIEKTTNREACRDLSGRRLRDINEEKRLRAWLDKQGEREREAEERKKRKIEKLLSVPKHEFKDAQYEEARSKVAETVNDAFEEGFKRELEAKEKAEKEEATSSTSKGVTQKRKTTEDEKSIEAKKKKNATKGAIWLGDDLSSSSDTSDDSDNEVEASTTSKITNQKSFVNN